MSFNSAVEELDFKNVEEMWLTEIIVYVCFLLIWYLLLKILWLFCISSRSPRLKQYDGRELKPVKAKAEESRRRASINVNTNDSMSSNQISNQTNTQMSQTNAVKTTPEELKLQICKIHRTLRLCFIMSLICTTINVTAIMANHTLIITNIMQRNCIVSRLPVTAILFQRVALFSFFIFRLHYSFRDTQFGIKPIFIYTLIICIILCSVCSTAYFFFIIVTASNPCSSDLVASASLPGISIDFLWNIFLSVLFLSRLGAAVKSQNRFTSTRDLEKAQLKKARANYKYYYTMYKLTCLFLVALIITICDYVIIVLTGLAAATSAIDSVASNYLLLLAFQFNDAHFKKVFCFCLRLQTCFLGADYAHEMELHFAINGSRSSKQQNGLQLPNGKNNLKTIAENTQTNDTNESEKKHLNINIIITPDTPMTDLNGNYGNHKSEVSVTDAPMKSEVSMTVTPTISNVIRPNTPDTPLPDNQIEENRNKCI